MKKLLIISALAASSVMYGATVVVPGADPLWQTLATPVATGGGVITGVTAYWNNDSIDASSPTNQCANIGCYLTSSGFFSPGDAYGSPNLSSPLYLANPGGSAVADFAFQGTSVGAPSVPVTLQAELASFAGNNWLGWYDSAFYAPGGAPAFLAADYNTKWGVIFTGSSNPSSGNNAVFTPTANFGLWFLSNFPATGPAIVPTDVANALNANSAETKAYFTESSGETATGTETTNKQHFALFATTAPGAIPADYWVGIEDTPLTGGLFANGHFNDSDSDYQDMVVHLRIVPEPGYYVLLSLGLAGLGLARRRMNKTSVN